MENTTLVTEDSHGDLQYETQPGAVSIDDLQKSLAAYTISPDGTMTVLKSRYGFHIGNPPASEVEFQEDLKKQTFTERRIERMKAESEDYRMAFEEEERNNP